MASFKFDGVTEYSQQLERLANSRKPVGFAVFDGAAVVADNVKNAINSLPTYTRAGKGKIKGVTPQQKKDLLNGLGIARLREDNDFINVKVGFDGYGSRPTQNYPRGLPNQLLARAITSGTSFRVKTPAIRTAIRKSKEASQKAMQKRCEIEIEKLFKE